jgi:hypothetical protein
VVIVLTPMIPWLVYAGFIILFFSILSLPLAMYLFRNRGWIARIFEKMRGSTAKFIEKESRLWRNVVFFALFFLLIFHLTNYLNEFTPALEISNLLYTSANDHHYPERAKLIRWILAADRDNLERHFRVLLWGTLQAGLVLALAWHVVSPLRLRVWLLAPFTVIFMLYTLFLPIAYGSLMHPIRFPVVVLVSQNEVVSAVKGNLFLLNKTEREFILWDQAAKRVLWIPDDQIKAAEVKEIRPLFEKGRDEK